MTPPTEVVSVIRHEVRPGHQQAYEAWTKEVVPIAQQFNGHHGVTILRPPDGAFTYTVVLHFDTTEHLREWLESDVRQLMIARVQPHLALPGEVEIRPGLDFWLSMPGHRRAIPHRQFLLALSVIFPLSQILPLILNPLLTMVPGSSIPGLRGLMYSAVTVGLMTYVIMPRYTRRVASWLYGNAG